jgi:carbamoyltransferase
VKNLVSIFGGHDANITFFNGQYHIIEIERLVKERYTGLYTGEVGLKDEEIVGILQECQDIATKFWGIENDYECVLINSQWKKPKSLIRNIFKSDKYLTLTNHHYTHAYSAFYQSPYKEALILSYDGGGEKEYFNFYSGDSNGITLLNKIPINMGQGYWRSASLIKQITERSKTRRSYPGKLMGLAGYGNVKEDLLPDLYRFFIEKDGKIAGMISDCNYYRGTGGENLAATIQKTLEDLLFKELDKYDTQIPLVVTGGCALNVIINEKIKDRYKREVYVPPNPNDGGLSLGHMFCYQKPIERVDVRYNGLPLLDKDELSGYNVKKVTKKEIAELIKDGKIVGLVYGDSEVGPRALGNRSIVCDPNIADMKNILNSKVKHRESYRPFAPFCKKEDAHKYFESRDFENMECMSFAVRVKVDTLPSITHIDNTARLQTVTQESHSHFYDLLTEFGKISDTNVLLNTSFNTRGKPILSTISDAVDILNTTELDHVIVNDYLIINNL